MNSDTAKIEAERIIETHLEYERDLKKFGKIYFTDFFGDMAGVGVLKKDLENIFPKK